jgi:glutamate-1-semialdehyde 2,1-aminomutase
MLAMAARLAGGLNAIISEHALEWHVSQSGARVEFVCAATPPRNGSEARAAMHYDLEGAIHLYLTNRGILLAPFHNMMLLSPVTQAAQVDHLLRELRNCVAKLQET